MIAICQLGQFYRNRWFHCQLGQFNHSTDSRQTTQFFIIFIASEVICSASSMVPWQHVQRCNSMPFLTIVRQGTDPNLISQSLVFECIAQSNFGKLLQARFNWICTSWPTGYAKSVNLVWSPLAIHSRCKSSVLQANIVSSWDSDAPSNHCGSTESMWRNSTNQQ